MPMLTLQKAGSPANLKVKIVFLWHQLLQVWVASAIERSRDLMVVSVIVK